MLKQVYNERSQILIMFTLNNLEENKVICRTLNLSTTTIRKMQMKAESFMLPI